MNDKEYKEYVLSKAQDDQDRLQLQFQSYRPSYIQMIEKVLDDYGLAERLQQINPTTPKIKILDLGCGEGSGLQTVAEVLEARGLAQNAEFFGLDRDKNIIAIAEKAKVAAKPPKPYLHYLVHDITVPLSKCLGLFFEFTEAELKDGEPQFDFIVASLVFEHIPDVRQYIERLYQKSLKPGGVFYIRDVITTEGEQGWKLAHPAMRPFIENGMAYVQSANGGIDISLVLADWFREWGAEPVAKFSTLMPQGGETETGLKMLRHGFMFIRNIGPLLVSKGFISQEEHDQAMKQLFNEIGPKCRGQLGLSDVIAQKPSQ